jgi:hypothetical protein
MELLKEICYWQVSRQGFTFHQHFCWQLPTPIEMRMKYPLKKNKFFSAGNPIDTLNAKRTVHRELR